MDGFGRVSAVSGNFLRNIQTAIAKSFIICRGRYFSNNNCSGILIARIQEIHTWRIFLVY